MLEDPTDVCGALVLIGSLHGTGCGHRRQRGDRNANGLGPNACSSDVEEHTSSNGNAVFTNHEPVSDSSENQRVTQGPSGPTS